MIALDTHAATVDAMPAGHDPWVGAPRLSDHHGVRAIETPATGTYDAIIVAVGLREYVDMGSDAIRALGKPDAVLYDIKEFLINQAAT